MADISELKHTVSDIDEITTTQDLHIYDILSWRADQTVTEIDITMDMVEMVRDVYAKLNIVSYEVIAGELISMFANNEEVFKTSDNQLIRSIMNNTNLAMMDTSGDASKVDQIKQLIQIQSWYRPSADDIHRYQILENAIECTSHAMYIGDFVPWKNYGHDENEFQTANVKKLEADPNSLDWYLYMNDDVFRFYDLLAPELTHNIEISEGRTADFFVESMYELYVEQYITGQVKWDLSLKDLDFELFDVLRDMMQDKWCSL